jgi:hypothetical protein
MPHHVFISHSSDDVEDALKVREALMERNIKCWISSEDIMPPMSYAEAIIDAINASHALLLLLTPSSNKSDHVKREVERAFSKRIPILAFQLSKFTLSKDMEYFLGLANRLDASDSAPEDYYERLITALTRLVEKSSDEDDFHDHKDAAPVDKHEKSPDVDSEEDTPVRWELKKTNLALLRLHITRESERSFHFSLADQSRAYIVPPVKETVERDKYYHLENLIAKVGRLRSSSKSKWKQIGTALYDTLLPESIQDILRHHSGSLVFATEELKIPWELLHDGRRFIGLEQPTAHIPDTYHWADSAFSVKEEAEFEHGEKRVLIVADPADDLPNTRENIRVMRSLFEDTGIYVDLLVGREDCSYARILNKLQNKTYNIIHFATRVHYLPERQSATLVLANDQWLTSEEICSALKGNPLIFVDGYHYKKPKQEKSSEEDDSRCLRALAQGFVHGNTEGRARATVGTLSPMDGSTESSVAYNFYFEILRGTTLGEALCIARKKADKSDGPHAWNRYVLFGHPHNCMVGFRQARVPDVETSESEEKAPPMDYELLDGFFWSDEMRIALFGAFAAMSQMNWPYLSTLHMLLGLTYIENGLLYCYLSENEIDPASARRELRKKLSAESEQSVISFNVSEGLQSAMEAAQQLAKEENARYVEEQHLLRVILDHRSSTAYKILEAMDLSPEALQERALKKGKAQGIENGELTLFGDDGKLVEQSFTSEALSAIQEGQRAALEDRWKELRSPHIFMGMLTRQGSSVAERLRERRKDAKVLALIISKFTCRPQNEKGELPELSRDKISDSAKRVLEDAKSEAIESGESKITEDMMLRAIVLSSSNFVAMALKKIRIDSSELLLQ